MEQFVFYADWQVGGRVEDDLIAFVDREWDRADDSFCSGRDRHNDEVLSLSFDVTAESAEDASAAALQRLRDFGERVRLSGQVVRLRGYTLEGWFDAELG